MRVDLHCHSSVSDGTRPPAEMMRRARSAGLDAVALTDHDTQAGHEQARAALPEGLELIPGMELSCRLEGHSVHLLAYWADPSHPELAAECQAILEGRLRRGREMVERLRELGVDITWEQVRAIAGNDVVGRPHVADALVRAGVVERAREAFTAEWIGAGGRAHVRKYAPDPARAIELVSAAGGVSVLAHPGSAGRGWKVPDAQVAALAAAGLAGLEVAHPDHDEVERTRLTALARKLGLVVTGGSDDHGERTGDRIGCETTDPAEFERLASLAPGRARARRQGPPAGPRRPAHPGSPGQPGPLDRSAGPDPSSGAEGSGQGERGGARGQAGMPENPPGRP